MSLTPSPEPDASTPHSSGPILPSNWVVKQADEGLRVIPPRSFSGAALVGVLLAVSLGGATLWSWWDPIWMAGIALAGLTLVANFIPEEWRLGPNLLETRRSLLGFKWVTRFQDASLVASGGHDEPWSLQVYGGDRVQSVISTDSIEELVHVAGVVTSYTGWALTSSDGSTMLLRELFKRALTAKRALRLGELLRDEKGPAALALVWRGQSAVSRRGVADLLATVTNPAAVLYRAIASDNPPTRVAAVELLGELGDPEVLPRIRQALSDPSELVRTHAATMLGRLQDQEVVPTLCAALSHGGDFPLTAAWALGEIGDVRAVRELSDVLASGGRVAEGDLRRTAAVALGRLGDRAAVQVLCDALTDPVAAVREGAAEALGVLGCSSAALELCGALDDPEEGVVTQAITALRILRYAPAAEALGACVRHKSTRVRSSALRTLGVIGGEPAVALLCAGLRDRSAGVRRSAAEAIGVFAEACDDAPIVLRSALEQLARMCGRLSTERGDVKRACAAAYSKIERRTASIKDLPLPAALGEHSAATLPRSVQPELDQVAAEVPSLRRR